MKKTISESDLNARKSKGATVNRPTEKPKPTPQPKPNLPKPEPAPPAETTSNQSLVQTLLSTTLTVANENSTRLTESVQEAMAVINQARKTIAYDLIIKRNSRSGLMESVRIQPVREPIK